MEITPAIAIRDFFSVPGYEVGTKEIATLKNTITRAEYLEFAEACAKALGKVLKVA